MRFLVAGLAVLLTAAGAAAADRKVPSTDYPTIQAAADAAVSGDRILIGKGPFSETVTLAQSNVQVIGKGTIFDGNEAGTSGVALSITGDNCSVSGITFRNGTSNLVVIGNGAKVSKCKFLRTSSYVPNLKITGTGAVVTGCTINGSLDTGINIAGDGASVSKTKITHSGEYGIVIAGTGATVSKNTVSVIEDSPGIKVTGNGATVSGNKVSYTDGSGIIVDSDDSTVSGNSSVACGDTCISVTGDRVTVTANKVSFTVDDADAIYVKSRTTAGEGLVEGNSVVDSVEYGIYCNNIYNVVVRNNTALRCGTEEEASFYITGNGNTIEGNTATEGEDDGFYVSGATNVLTGNKAINCQTDGFEIKGAGNSLDGCIATGCGGEGFDNKGTLTAFSNCTFLKNRIDLAADLTGGATFGVNANNKVGTGSLATQDQVD